MGPLGLTVGLVFEMFQTGLGKRDWDGCRLEVRYHFPEGGWTCHDLTVGDFVCQRYLEISGDVLGCCNERMTLLTSQEVKARHAVQHPTTHRGQFPAAGNYLAPNVSSAKLEKLHVGTFQVCLWHWLISPSKRSWLTDGLVSASFPEWNSVFTESLLSAFNTNMLF